MTRHVILLMLLLFGVEVALAQTTGNLQGTVYEELGGLNEPLPFAAVALKKGDQIVDSKQTDINGAFAFSNIPAGRYTVSVQYTAKPRLEVNDVLIRPGQTTKLGEELTYKEADVTDALGGEELIVVEYRIPLIETGKVTGNTTLGSEDINRRGDRQANVENYATTAAGVNSADEGEGFNADGVRASGNDTYVDGVRVIGDAGVADTDVDQIQIITSGVPARYGDATGVITNIITKGPSQRFSGGVQAETSELLDDYAESRVDVSISGPILKRAVYDTDGSPMLNADSTVLKRTSLGYRLAGTYFTIKDPRPSALGFYKLKDDVYENIRQNPLTRTDAGGLIPTAQLLTASDFEDSPVRLNARQQYAQFNGKLEYQLNDDMNIAVGGSYRGEKSKSAGTALNLLNYSDNPEFRSSTSRGYVRFRHRINTTSVSRDAELQDSANAALRSPLQNVSYELQFDYTRTQARQEDVRYGDKFFNYGFVGVFEQERVPTVGILRQDTVYSADGSQFTVNPVYGHISYGDRFLSYTPATDINPGLSRYNDLIDPSTIGSIREFPIANGNLQSNYSEVYGLYQNAHMQFNRYAKTRTDQFRFTAQGNLDIVNPNPKVKDPIRHRLEFGVAYEQRIYRNYSLSPFGLWELGNQRVNEHLSTTSDTTRPTEATVFDNLTNRFYTVYEHDIRQDLDENNQPIIDPVTGLPQEVQQSVFGRRLRESLGLDKRDWVYVSSLRPEQLELGMFEANTLIEGRRGVLTYYGFDYLGNPTGSDVSFNDFFTARDSEGILTRAVAPFQPIYTAAYIEDQFTYKDFNARIGVRFDRYDANTSVPKDPYVIGGSLTAADFDNQTADAQRYTIVSTGEFARPSNIGDDFVVYMSSNDVSSAVAGYRDGDQWYNAQGAPVNNANSLGTLVAPALQEGQTSPQSTTFNPDLAFEDYTPSIVIMPRIAFSFPISDIAMFYANYDVLAQRPDVASSLATPLSYYNFEQIVEGNGIIANPNLESQRTINYEVGYEQALNDFSKIKLSLLYKEQRGLIQLRQYVKAFPIDRYRSYANEDFSTVKTFKFEYDLRPHPTKNKNIRILANYALQFAEGTGSSPTSSAGNLVDDLKYIFPLNFEQRHAFFLNFDFRYGEGKYYNGPTIGKSNFLENTGANISFNLTSGTPYTRREVPGSIDGTVPSRNTIGSVNGARTPWNFRINLRFDRDFVIKTGKSDNARTIRANVYVRVTNLLNTQNVLNVYPATGSPTDDGFLTSPNSIGVNLAAARPEAYTLLYNYRMNSPFNISRPRRIYLGTTFSF